MRVGENEMKKERNVKMKKLVSLIMCLSFLSASVLTACGSNESNAGEASVTGEVEVMEKADNTEDISSYGFTSCARFGSLPLGISFLLPEREGYYSQHSTVHGSNYPGATCSVYIDMVLDKPDVTLEEIPYVLQAEYKEEKYRGRKGNTHILDSSGWIEIYDVNDDSEYEIKKTKKTKIGDYDVCYFETGKYGYDDDEITMGYSLFFDGKPLFVHTEVNEAEIERSGKEEIRNELKWTILSFEKYSGEGFYEMYPDANFLHYNLNGMDNENYLENEGFEGEKTVLCMNMGGRSKASEIWVYMNSEYFAGCTVDNILERVLESEEVREKGTRAFSYYDEVDADALDLKKEPFTINGFEMMKYTGNHGADSDEYKRAFIVYTMMFEDLPYIFEFEGNYYSKIEGEDDYLDDEQEENMLKELEYRAFETINTLRKVEDGVNSMNYYNYYN